MNGKPWYMSKTIWCNVITVAISVGTQFADILPTEMAAKLLGVVGVLNIILRFVTDEPVTK